MAYDDFSIQDSSLSRCKKMNRYQRQAFWETKSINKLLLAIQQGYVPVGSAIVKEKMRKNKTKSDPTQRD